MDTKRSCIDCHVVACRKGGEGAPQFCVGESVNEELMSEAMAVYDDPFYRRVMQTAAAVEADGYLQWPRVTEIVEFAKRMGFKRLGIATCVGLLNESRILADVLRSHGFEVFGAACKAGSVPKTEVGICNYGDKVGHMMCNPALQAKILNREKTELNIVVGLCVGHDSVFYKHSDAIVTTLVTKDRVTGHNPVAPLYTANSYSKSIYGPERK